MRTTMESLVKISLINKAKPSDLNCLQRSTNQKSLFNEYFTVIGKRNSHLINLAEGGDLSPTGLKMCIRNEKF